MKTDSLHEYKIGGEELMKLVRHQLSLGQTVRFLPFRGRSMLPMLRQTLDSVEIMPLPERLKKYDLPVYQYPSGKYVMHRIVGRDGDAYICLGDNTYRYEYIRREQMIGLVCGFCRGERYISVKTPCYRLYCRLWVVSYPVRKLLVRIYRRIKRVLK